MILGEYTSLAILIFKWIFVAAGAMYVLFALIIVRQIALMTKNVQDKFNGTITLVGYLHLLFALAFVVYLVLFL